MKKMAFYRNLLMILITALTMVSCRLFKEDEEDKIRKINKEIYLDMKDIYLWNYKMPQVNYMDYNTPEKLMDALLYKSVDRWSTILTSEEFNRYFEAGQMIGHGMSMALDGEGNIRIALLYRSTKAYLEGVRRGWIIKKVNSVEVSPDNVFSLLGASEIGIRNTIEFINLNGETVTLNLIKEVVDLTPVLYSDTLLYGGKKIGYLVFQDFILAANEELDSVFSVFRNAGVEELIIDMRYNGGGDLKVAEYMAGWLMGKNHAGEAFVKLIHNEDNHRYDTTVNIPAFASGFDLSRIFFIGTEETASASELLMNGVKPYLQAYAAGTNTHGKPVGMYAIPLNASDHVILPVCFKYTNALNVGDFYEGLLPDFSVADDVTHDFGDPQEDCLESLLNYIVTGSATFTAGKTTGRPLLLNPKGPLGQFVKAF